MRTAIPNKPMLFPSLIRARVVHWATPFIGAFLVLVAGMVNAQLVIDGRMSGQVINVTDEGASIACGYRVIVTSKSDGSGGRRALDAVLMLTKNGIVSKFEAKEMPKGLSGLDSLVPVKTHGGWLKVPGKQPAAPLAEIPEGMRRPPPTMSLVDTDGGIEVFDAILRGQPIQVGVRWKPEVESIYVGKVEIKQSMVDQFYSCVNELKTTLTKPKRDSNS